MANDQQYRAMEKRQAKENGVKFFPADEKNKHTFRDFKKAKLQVRLQHKPKKINPRMNELCGEMPRLFRALWETRVAMKEEGMESEINYGLRRARDILENMLRQIDQLEGEK